MTTTMIPSLPLYADFFVFFWVFVRRHSGLALGRLVRRGAVQKIEKACCALRDDTAALLLPLVIGWLGCA